MWSSTLLQPSQQKAGPTSLILFPQPFTSCDTRLSYVTHQATITNSWCSKIMSHQRGVIFTYGWDVFLFPCLFCSFVLVCFFFPLCSLVILSRYAIINITSLDRMRIVKKMHVIWSLYSSLDTISHFPVTLTCDVTKERQLSEPLVHCSRLSF